MKDIVAMHVVEEVMDMIHALCVIAGNGLYSGIRPGESGDRAATYILSKLHAADLTTARFEPIKVNNPYPSGFEVTVETEGEKTSLSEQCFPMQYCMETPSNVYDVSWKNHFGKFEYDPTTRNLTATKITTNQ